MVGTIGAFAGISTENVLVVRIKGMKETNVTENIEPLRFTHDDLFGDKMSVKV